MDRTPLWTSQVITRERRKAIASEFVRRQLIPTVVKAILAEAALRKSNGA